MPAFPHLLRPVSIGKVPLRNRMVMGAMHTLLETLDRPEERLAAFYAARAEGEIGLILTGGFAPVPEGVMDPRAPVLSAEAQLPAHRAVVEAVHRAGGRIVVQILHAGRYARVPGCVAPSPLRARINAFAPRALAAGEVRETVAAFGRTAALARAAGYDGVEVMGSEGYLLNEFTAAATNLRDDEYGGSFERRIRFPVEVVRAVRAALGDGLALVYRISSIDLVEGGSTAEEVAALARAVEAAGADLLNTGVGWHESAVPTIAASVPRAAWREAVANVKRAVSIPVMASNRINTPEVAEALLEAGVADLVSMARPLLADPAFARKVRLGRPEEIAPCVACNQACLDRIFTERAATCLVNPRAGREVDLPVAPASRPRRVAVVGGGPAGMACAAEAARRGHQVTLFEAAEALGGQLLLAQAVPGKAEFRDLLRYFQAALVRARVSVRLAHRATAADVAGFDEVVLASGVQPRRPEIPGIGHRSVVGYADLLSGRIPPGERVAVLGAGGVGFDVAEFLLGDPAETREPAAFLRAWGVDPAGGAPGGLAAPAPRPAPRRQVHLFQRKPDAPGRSLGRTTGWILKARLKRAGLVMVPGASYQRIDDAGLHYAVDGASHLLPVDQVVICAGQEPERGLAAELERAGLRPHLVGGAAEARELDAARAIDEATRLAVAL